MSDRRALRDCAYRRADWNTDGSRRSGLRRRIDGPPDRRPRRSCHGHVRRGSSHGRNLCRHCGWLICRRNCRCFRRARSFYVAIDTYLRRLRDAQADAALGADPLLAGQERLDVQLMAVRTVKFDPHRSAATRPLGCPCPFQTNARLPFPPPFPSRCMHAKTFFETVFWAHLIDARHYPAMPCELCMRAKRGMQLCILCNFGRPMHRGAR